MRKTTTTARGVPDAKMDVFTLTADLMTQVLKKSRVRKCGMCAGVV